MENKLLELIAEDSEVEIPESMIKREAEYLYGLFIQRLAMDGIGEEYYLNATGRSKEEMLAAFDPQARTRIVQDLIIEAVREKEGIDVSEEEVDDRIKEYMSEYNADELGPEAQEEMREYWNKQRDGISLAIAREKTMELIVANARIAEVEALQEGEGAAEESAEN
jgi:trigger factor